MVVNGLAENSQAARFIRFGIVGLFANAFLLGLFALLVHLGTNPAATSLFVYAVGLAGTYAAQRSWSFRSYVPHRTAAPRFIAVHAAGASIQTTMLYFGSEVLHLDPILVQLGSMLLVALLVYTLLERFAFNGHLAHRV